MPNQWRQWTFSLFISCFVVTGLFINTKSVQAGENALDAVFANRINPDLQNRVCLGDGLGSFAFCDPINPDGRDTWDMAVGDVNNDGHLDAVFSNGGSTSIQFNQVCLGNGEGGFSSCNDIDSIPGRNFGVALGDINKDTFLDAIFAVGNGASKVCEGNGDGSFDCSDLNNSVAVSRGVALADLNKDTYLDVVVANRNLPNQVCLGNGQGAISNCAFMSGVIGNSFRVALSDINGDTNVDALFARGFQQGSIPNMVCLGNGDGTFAACTTIAGANNFSRPTANLALANLDSDTHQDIVFTGEGGNEVCLGDGTGGFSCSGISMPFSSPQGRGVALGDTNGDTFLDALFANHEQPNVLCLGDGQGSFSPCAAINNLLNDSHAVALVELNTLDETPPVITPSVVGTLGSNGWYISNVEVSWNVSDSESTITSSTGCETVIVNTDTSGIPFTCSGTSEGGTTEERITVKRDATAPIVSLVSPPDGATYILLQAITADWIVVDTLSGVGTVNASAPNGALIDTATAGVKAFTVSATDLAGNPITVTHTYTVLTASEGIDALILQVQSLSLQHGIDNSLVKKLENAKKDLGKGDVAGALDKLQSFIDEATAQKGKKIAPAVADALITQAQLIIAALSPS